MTEDCNLDRPVRKESRLVRNSGIIFIACCFLGVVTQSFWWIVPGIPCWLVAAFVESRQQRRFAREMEDFRNSNKLRYTHIFSGPATTGLNDLIDSAVDLYDCESYTYLGVVPKRDLQLVLESYVDTPDLLQIGDNDIPFTIDDLEAIPVILDKQFSEEFVDAMKPIADNDYLMQLILRWTPQSQNAG